MYIKKKHDTQQNIYDDKSNILLSFISTDLYARYIKTKYQNQKNGLSMAPCYLLGIETDLLCEIIFRVLKLQVIGFALQAEV